ncbi:hypothetical protein AB0M50_28110 [Nonomuraea fuscirosea]|jgi:hypothetical protein|uniref:hypothetical protein n=1 Tax=Nonomuraea fuscirosea TaxID=1291556 RepID=UPI00343ACEC1
MIDRFSERGVLDRLVSTVRAGHSQVLVWRGEAGMGKTALLEYLTGQASQCQVARVVGVQWEMELAFAGLHQLIDFRALVAGCFCGLSESPHFIADLEAAAIPYVVAEHLDPD